MSPSGPGRLKRHIPAFALAVAAPISGTTAGGAACASLPGRYDRPCCLAGTWRAAHPPNAGADSVISRASLCEWRRQVTATECNQQTVTNWLQYAHIADSARG